MRKRKRGTLRRCAAFALALTCILCCAAPVFAAPPDEYVPGGTDGTEMQLMQPVQLEIRLGQEWAGIEFTLVTDAGQYPGTIPVAGDGTLRMELGGSQTYVLRLASPTAPMPTDTPVEEDPDASPEPAGNAEDPAEQENDVSSPDGTERDGGIPVFPLVLFGAGILIAVGVLIVMKIIAKRQTEEEDDDDDSEYDDDEDDG